MANWIRILTFVIVCIRRWFNYLQTVTSQSKCTVKWAWHTLKRHRVIVVVSHRSACRCSCWLWSPVYSIVPQTPAKAKFILVYQLLEPAGRMDAAAVLIRQRTGVDRWRTVIGMTSVIDRCLSSTSTRRSSSTTPARSTSSASSVSRHPYITSLDSGWTSSVWYVTLMEANLTWLQSYTDHHDASLSLPGSRVMRSATTSTAVCCLLTTQQNAFL